MLTTAQAAKLPTTLRKHASRIDEYENSTWVDNGHWIYYKRGWKSASDPLGNQHQDHEDTLRELAICAKDALHCDCDDCKC